MAEARIRVSYSELRSSGNFSNVRAEAAVEVDSSISGMEEDFAALWDRARAQVRTVLDKAAEEANAPVFHPYSAYATEDGDLDEGEDEEATARE